MTRPLVLPQSSSYSSIQTQEYVSSTANSMGMSDIAAIGTSKEVDIAETLKVSITKTSQQLSFES